MTTTTTTTATAIDQSVDLAQHGSRSSRCNLYGRSLNVSQLHTSIHWISATTNHLAANKGHTVNNKYVRVTLYYIGPLLVFADERTRFIFVVCLKCYCHPGSVS